MPSTKEPDIPALNDLSTLQTLFSSFEDFLPHLITAVFMLLIGIFVVKQILKIIDKFLEKSNVNPNLHGFIRSISKIALYLVVAFIAADELGIQPASLVAVVGAAGLALSLALQGSLSNVASGLTLLATQPFDIDDYIEVNGVVGTVVEIGLTYTVLRKLDNAIIYIPNAEMSSNKIINYSSEDRRRLDLQFSIGYSNDIEEAKQIIQKVTESTDLAFQDPKPRIEVCAHNSSSIDLICWVWTTFPNLKSLEFYMYEQVKIEFDKAGINIPYPQIDIHLVSDATKTAEN